MDERDDTPKLFLVVAIVLPFLIVSALIFLAIEGLRKKDDPVTGDK